MDFLTRNLIINPLLIAALVSLIVTPLTIKLAWKFGLVDDPKKRKHPAKLHKKITPRAGVIPIWVSLVIASLVFLPPDRYLLGILGGATIFLILGILDDKYDINPYIRLVGCILAAGITVFSGVKIFFITNPLGGDIIHFSQPLAIIFAVLWISFLSNITNWSSGFDGQLPGIVVIAALTIAFLSFRFSADITQWPVTILAAITAGAFLGFLPYNFFPQKIMPGYGGGSLAGYFLAVLAILSGAKVATAILVLGVPMVDAVYSILRRLLQGKSPFWGDRGHLHHKLMDLGWGKRRIALFYWLVSVGLGLVALQLNTQLKLYTIVLLVLVIGGVLLWLYLATYFLKKPGRDSG